MIGPQLTYKNKMDKLNIGLDVLYKQNLYTVYSFNTKTVELIDNFDRHIVVDINQVEIPKRKYCRYIKKNSITDIVVKDKTQDKFYNTLQVEGEPYYLHFWWWSIPLWWKSKKTVIEFAILDKEQYSESYFKCHDTLCWDDEDKIVCQKPRVMLFNNKDLLDTVYFETYDDALNFAKKFIADNGLDKTYIKWK